MPWPRWTSPHPQPTAELDPGRRRATGRRKGEKGAWDIPLMTSPWWRFHEIISDFSIPSEALFASEGEQFLDSSFANGRRTVSPEAGPPALGRT